MWGYAIRRAFGSVPTLFALATITFFMMRVAPGGPFSGNRRIPRDIIANIETKRCVSSDKHVYAFALVLGVEVGELFRP